MFFITLQNLTLSMSLIVTLAFVFSKTPIFKRTIRGNVRKREKALLILFFGGIGILGTYIGVPVDGVLANSRIIGIAAGGLLGGPVVGVMAGILAGGHRFLLGGATALSCGIATVLAGMLTGFISKSTSPRVLTWKETLVIGMVAEVMEILLILLSLPWASGVKLMETIAFPVIFMNGIGIALFYGIVQSALAEEDRIGALQAQKALQIANLTLPILKMGLNERTAAQVVKIIFEHADYDAVSITDGEKVLAFIGKGCDHHKGHMEIQTKATLEAIATGEIRLVESRTKIGCPNKGCPLYSALIVPLRNQDLIVGTLKIYRGERPRMSQVDWEFASGLAMIFSTQLELAELEVKTKLINKAELRALEAQINPHFLFNAINTIVSFCRTNPEKARELLLRLGDFFRKNLQSGEGFVTLEEECEHIRSYLAIEEARFSDRLKIIEDIQPEALSWRLPGLTLQPLVENAIKHGVYPSQEPGEILIQAVIENKYLKISIQDNGVGIEEETLKQIQAGEKIQSKGLGIGLNNVSQRLEHAYHGQAQLVIESEIFKGTTITLFIPEIEEVGIA